MAQEQENIEKQLRDVLAYLQSLPKSVETDIRIENLKTILATVSKWL